MTEQRVLMQVLNGVQWQLDPTGNFRDVPRGRISEAVGVLPYWVRADDERTAKAQLQANYAFFMGWDTWEEMVWHEDGSYDYPGDPTQYPLVKGSLRGQDIYIYRNSFVAVHDPQAGWAMTRMD